jgi:hypothetical protein
MSYANKLKRLKELLEGKTVSRIEASTAREGLCKFVLSNGTAFELCANDLGFWIEDEGGEDE